MATAVSPVKAIPFIPREDHLEILKANLLKAIRANDINAIDAIITGSKTLQGWIDNAAEIFFTVVLQSIMDNPLNEKRESEAIFFLEALERNEMVIDVPLTCESVFSIKIIKALQRLGFAMHPHFEAYLTRREAHEDSPRLVKVATAAERFFKLRPKAQGEVTYRQFSDENRGSNGWLKDMIGYNLSLIKLYQSAIDQKIQKEDPRSFRAVFIDLLKLQVIQASFGRRLSGDDGKRLGFDKA